MKKFFIIFILFFSFLNFSFADDDEKICSKESKTVEPLYGEEIIFDIYPIVKRKLPGYDYNPNGLNYYEKGEKYEYTKSLEKYFYQDSGYVCLNGKVLYSLSSQSYFYLSTEKPFEGGGKIKVKQFNFLGYNDFSDGSKRNVIKYLDYIFLGNRDFFYFSDLKKSDFSEKNIYCSKDSKNLKPLFGEKIIFDFEINSSENLEKYFYEDSGFLCLNGKVLYLGHDKSNSLLINNNDGIEKIETKNFKFLGYDGNNNFLKYNYYSDKVFIGEKNNFKFFEEYDNSNEKKYFFNLKENKIEKLENNDEKYEEIINEKSDEKTEINHEEINKNLENFHNKFETNKNLFFSVGIIVFLTILIIILDFKNRKKEKEEFEKLDF